LGHAWNCIITLSPLKDFIMRLPSIPALIVCLAAAAWPQDALATFHIWQISQVYSNAGGSVQYVEFVLPSALDDERFVGGHALSAGLNSNSITLPSNLPSLPVTGQHFLIATSGFDAVAGVTPDYTFPVAPFFSPSGDTLNWAGFDSFTFPALPSNGIDARNRDGSIVVNAPINFAGQTGSAPEPSTLLLAGIGAAVALMYCLRVRRRGSFCRFVQSPP
jgi:PEP-CTERM motif